VITVRPGEGERAGRLLAVVPAELLGRRLLLLSAVVRGFGHAGVRLDRGQPGPVRLVELRATGSGVAVIALNRHHGAGPDLDAADPAAVAGRESFATSVLRVLPMLDRRAGELEVDLTDLLLTDLIGAGAALDGYTVDAARSFPLPEHLVVRPDRVEAGPC
jgi:hypothetical protein